MKREKKKCHLAEWAFFKQSYTEWLGNPHRALHHMLVHMLQLEKDLEGIRYIRVG
jgi:hypothetical protein